MKHFPIVQWNLTQHKQTTQDWMTALKMAVWKRSRDMTSPLCMGLSDGYDSGAIHLALSLHGIPHRTFTVANIENRTVIGRRLRKGSQTTADYVSMQPEIFMNHLKYLEKFAEPHQYEDPPWPGYGIMQDEAAPAISRIVSDCKAYGGRALISGHGGDEILSRYIKDPPAHFPENLSSIFPWSEFYVGRMRNFLMKEESVAGAHGFETRYPLLDRYVVQEFLYLDSNIKSSVYKRPIHDFFLQHSYPFTSGQKKGFVYRTTFEKGWIDAFT